MNMDELLKWFDVHKVPLHHRAVLMAGFSAGLCVVWNSKFYDHCLLLPKREDTQRNFFE